MAATLPSLQEILNNLNLETLARKNPFAHKDSYSLDDFLAFRDDEFVSQAYYAILKRPPDPDGLDNYAKGLADGLYTRVYILGVLRRSAEGQARAVPIHGLDRLYPIHRARCLVIKLFRRHFSMPQSRLRRRVTTLERELAAIKERTATRYDLEGLANTVQAFRRDRLALAKVLERRVFSAVSTTMSQPSVDSAFYSGLEAAFRGAEKDITQGLTCFLPWAGSARKSVGEPFIAVDLGCGRGEWLALLREHRMSALGVDLNPLFVEQCREKGLEAHEAEIMTFLSCQPNSSVGLVSAFHVLEHLDFAQQYHLLQEIHRVLAPGGFAILETPNPRNILVGSGDFYRDPTHRAPVFPDTLALLGKHLGFSPSEAYFFQENRAALMPVESVSFDDINDYVNVSRDFVWIGGKT